MLVHVVITSYSGFATPPAVVVPQPQTTQSQGRPSGPTLRLVR
jgi:hypothetical protein